MAGEFEEPYSISFQTDSLHSGSISFGRFESEELSWERRSSFSHNKYLEEVEKYSKPGSVTEKKAYFEAHFKKKGMRLPGSFEGQLRGEYCSDNDVFENMDHKDEDDLNGSGNHHQFDDGVLENDDYMKSDDGYDRDQFHHANCSSSQFGHFDESPKSSEYHGEHEVIECERECSRALSVASPVVAILSHPDVLSKDLLENMKPQEVQATEMRSEKIATPEIIINENLNDDVTNLDESFMPIEPLSEKATAGIDKTAENKQTLSPKLGSAMESKAIKPRLKSQVCTSHFQKRSCNDASKTAANKQIRKEGDYPWRMKSEKQSPQSAIPTRRLLSKTPKGEDSESCNPRSSLPNKSVSEKDQKLKKAVESQSCGSKKVEPRVRQSPNRVKQTVASAKLDTRTNTTAFSFKSDERAERRKEFYMKLEEKMNAKEAEMNQIQAKTQEKTEDEIKQFRKSLNFKATPMPSFYHSAASPGSTGNKAASSKTEGTKTLKKLTSPGKGAATRSQLLSKVGDNHDVLAGKPVKTLNATTFEKTDGDVTKPSEAGETLQTNMGSHLEDATKNGVTSKDSEKVKDTNPQRQRTSENSKMLKDQRAEGKSKMGNRRHSTGAVRTSIKGVGIGGNSGLGGHVAVDVAS